VAKKKGPTPKRRVVHALPPEGAAFTPCCNRTLFELPETDQVTSTRKDVNCRTRDRQEKRDPAELEEQIKARLGDT